MIRRRHVFMMALAAAMTGSVFAAENLPATHLAQRGKLLLSEDLSQAPADVVTDKALTKMKSGWKLWSGHWVFADGAMKGTQQASDGRGAVAACVFPFKNAVIQFEVRLDDCRQVHFRVQDSIPEHICRVIITTSGFAAQKDDHDHGGPDQPVPFGRAALAIKPAEWTTVLVEVLGEAMTVSIDRQQIHGSHPLIASPKAFFDFVVSGGSASFRNLRVWQALPASSDSQGNVKPSPPAR
jgi:hypothetical protein